MIKFYYEIFYRRKNDVLTIDSVLILSRNSIEAEKEFDSNPVFKNCERLDTVMLERGSYAYSN